MRAPKYKEASTPRSSTLPATAAAFAPLPAHTTPWPWRASAARQCQLQYTAGHRSDAGTVPPALHIRSTHAQGAQKGQLRGKVGS
jgi:hypothetical protein